MPEISERELTQLRQAVQELTILNQIASAINISMSVDQISKTVVEHCCRRIKAEQGAIFLLDKDEDEQERFKTFVREMEPGEGQIPFHLNTSLLGWMLKNKKIIVSNHPESDNRLTGVDFKKVGIRSLIATPLLSRKGLTGLLVLFNKKDEDGFEQQDERFLGIVSTQVAKVIENARLFEREARLADLEREMKVAQSIQEGALPKSNIVAERFEVFGYSDQAKEVGGDYYDMLQLDDFRVFVSLGDVAGKGLPAALLTGNAQAVLHSHLHRDTIPHLPSLANCLNNLICDFTSPEQYLTAIFGVYDAEMHEMRFVNAGHLLPAVVRANGTVEMPEGGDVVIGVMPGLIYNPITIPLSPGDTFIVFTDGVTETINEADELFGEERLEEALRGSESKSPEQISRDLMSVLLAYRGKAEQADDTTMLILRAK